jgi:hypothetical protein
VFNLIYQAIVILPAIFSLITAARLARVIGSSESKRGSFNLESFGNGNHHSQALKTTRSSVDSSNKASERMHPENELNSVGFGAPAYGSVGSTGFGGSPVQGFGGPAGHNQGAGGFGFGSQPGSFGGPSASFGGQSGSFGGQFGSFGGPSESFGGQSGYGGAQGGASGYGSTGGYGENSVSIK